MGLKSEDQDNQVNIQSITEGAQIVLKTTVQNNEAVRLDLRIRLSDIINVRTRNVGVENKQVQVPQVSRSDIQLSAVVPKGKCLAIWGFEKEVTATVKQPVMKSVPYVSRMFTNTATGTDTQDMLMVITPQVLGSDDAAD